MQAYLGRLSRKNGDLAGQPPTALIQPGIGSSAREDPAQSLSIAPPLPWAAKILSALVFAIGLALLGYLAPQLPNSGLVGLVLLTLMAAAADRMTITVYGDSRVSVGFVCLFAVAVLYGPQGVVVASGATALALHLPNKIISYRFLFNFGLALLTKTSAALVLLSIVGGHQDITISAQVLSAALAAAAADYALGTTLLATIVSLTSRQSFVGVWREQYQWALPHYVLFGFLGLAMAVAYQQIGSTGLLVFAAPPLMMRLSIKQYIDKTTRNVAMLKQKNEQLRRANREILAISDRLKDTYDATLEALAAALDARDSETGGHSGRVTVYTMEMAKEMGVIEGSNDWLDIERASLLHDVGKIGVSDAILNKPGPLTAEEWQQMRRHPAIGYEMLKDVKFLSEAAEIVYAHHERYDGRGYPTGLCGEDIPLGARVFAVADAFDAMTSNRPYRRALSTDSACEEITSNSGSQFDPAVVEAFLKCLPRWIANSADRVAA